MTLGVSITSATAVTVSPINIMTNTNMPETSELRTIIPSPQVLHVDKQYYFSNANGSFPLPKLLASIVPSSNTISVTVDVTTGMPTSGFFVMDSEILSYSGITSNVLNNISRCLTNSCDPLNPPGHSTFTIVGSSQVPNYIGVGYTQGDRNIALMKLTLYAETNFNIRSFSLDLGRP